MPATIPETEEWKAVRLNRRWVIFADGEIVCELPVEDDPAAPVDPALVAARALLIETAPLLLRTIEHIERLCAADAARTPADTEAFITSVCEIARDAGRRARA